MNTIASLRMHKIFDRFDIAGSVYTAINGIEKAFTSVTKLIGTWMRNVKGRGELARMSPHMMRDIGLDHVDIQIEINKPFWKS